MAEGQQGPVMLVATNMMRPPPTRIGKIGDNFTLPRTIPLMSALAGGAGLFFGLMLGLPFLGMLGVRALLLGGVLGAMAGIAVATMSPLKGESMARWLGLSVGRIRASKVEIDGRPARVYIGIAPLTATALGAATICSGAADVMPGSVDERGVIIPHSEMLRERREMASTLTSSRSSDWAPAEVRHLPQPGKPAKRVEKAEKKVEQGAPAGAGLKLPTPRTEKRAPVKAPTLSKGSAPAKRISGSKSKPLTPPKA